MKARNGWMRGAMILAVGAIGLAFTVGTSAQIQTSKDETKGTATHEVKVERAEVIAVSGNDLVLKMEDGSLRHIANVPESARATVDGKQVGIHDVKVGMKLERTITTTTTPKVITTTQSVTGTVWHVNPPLSLILTMENGENRQFKIPKGQKFNVNGQMLDAFSLKKGMRVTATRVVEEPVTEVEQRAKLTGKMPPPPPPPPADMPILVAVIEAPAPVAPAAPAPAPQLPKTGSELPITGLLGFLLIAGSAGIRMVKKIRG